MRSQPLKKSQEEKLLDVKKSKEIYERYCIEGQSLKEILSKVDVSRSSIYRIIRKFEVENPEIANLMKKKGKVIIDSIKTRAREVADVSGAGDTVISTIAFCLAGGAEVHESVYISNIAAGIVVEEVGIVPIQKENLLNQLISEFKN